jgi:hypothetical protein
MPLELQYLPIPWVSNLPSAIRLQYGESRLNDGKHI